MAPLPRISSDPPTRAFNLDEDHGITDALYREFALRESAFHSLVSSWPTEVTRLPDIGAVLASGRSSLQIAPSSATITEMRPSPTATHRSPAMPVAAMIARSGSRETVACSS